MINIINYVIFFMMNNVWNVYTYINKSIKYQNIINQIVVMYHIRISVLLFCQLTSTHTLSLLFYLKYCVCVYLFITFSFVNLNNCLQTNSVYHNSFYYSIYRKISG